MKNMKRILAVRIIRECDPDVDTSYYGGYSNSPTSEFSIDRAHSEDCDSVRSEIQAAKITLEHVQQTIGDLHNAVLAQYNGTLANDKLDSERDALDEAYNIVGNLIDEIDECDCGGHRLDSHEYRYFNFASGCPFDKSGMQSKEEWAKEMRKYARQDYDRVESLHAGNWEYIGIRAEAKYVAPDAKYDQRTVTQTIHSGGLWGIESDSDKSYFAEVEKEQLAELRSQLSAIGFSKRAISTAFKSIEEVER